MDTEPVARDEFAYGPDGARYYRKSSWRAEGGNGMGVTIGPASMSSVPCSSPCPGNAPRTSTPSVCA